MNKPYPFLFGLSLVTLTTTATAATCTGNSSPCWSVAINQAKDYTAKLDVQNTNGFGNVVVQPREAPQALAYNNHTMFNFLSLDGKAPNGKAIITFNMVPKNTNSTNMANCSLVVTLTPIDDMHSSISQTGSSCTTTALAAETHATNGKTEVRYVIVQR